MLLVLKTIAHYVLTRSTKKRRWFSRFDLIVLLLIIGAGVMSLLVPTSHPTQTSGTTFHGAGRGGVETTTINIDPTPPPFKIQGNEVTDPATNLTQSTLPTRDNGNLSIFNSKNGLLVVTDPALTSENKQVRTFWWVMVAIVFAFTFILFILAGYRVMMGAVGFRYADALESLPRIMLALLGASFSLVFVSLFIALNNSLCQAVSSAVDTFGGLPGTYNPNFANATDSIGNILKSFASVFIGTFNGADLLNSIISIVVFVLLLMVSVQLFVRLALLNLLIIFSPLGFACWALPQGGGQQLTKLWMNAFFATVMVQFLQWTCYATGNAVFAGLNAAGIGGFGQPLIPFFQVTELAVLWLVLKIPGWLGNTVTNTMGEGSRTVSSTISQTVSAIQSIISTATLVLR